MSRVNKSKVNKRVFSNFELKIAGKTSETPGLIEGYGSVFSNVDFYGDIILPGAFTDSITEYKTKNRVIPMMVQHGLGDSGLVPIGAWTEFYEDDRGLYLKGKISGIGTERGAYYYELVKDGALGGLSVSCYILDYEYANGYRELKKLDLIEVSLCDHGANDEARISDVSHTSKSPGFAQYAMQTLGEIKKGIQNGSNLNHGQVAAIKSLCSDIEKNLYTDENDILSALKNFNS